MEKLHQCESLDGSICFSLNYFLENRIESTSLHNAITASRHRENKDQFICFWKIYTLIMVEGTLFEKIAILLNFGRMYELNNQFFIS